MISYEFSKSISLATNLKNIYTNLDRFKMETPGSIATTISAAASATTDTPASIHMEFAQKKLTGDEWKSLEVPVSHQELEILQMIRDGYKDVTVAYNHTQAMLSILKCERDEKGHMEDYVYFRYFSTIVDALQKFDKTGMAWKSTVDMKKEPAIKKADKIRMENMDKRLLEGGIRDNIYEFAVLAVVRRMLESRQKKRLTRTMFMKHYYSLLQATRATILDKNSHVMSFVAQVLKYYEPDIDLTTMVIGANEIIESNTEIELFEDMRLYDHQKRLFNAVKRPGPKLILYQAPTGTGKTVSPIGLVEGHYLIFVCAAKHVGLQLAKSLISLEVPIAVAFGCKATSDIRLHYFAAKEYTVNYKSGGIYKVDNSVGDKVRVIISDVESFVPSMLYMTAFRKPEECIVYWDEPTISMDYASHPFHETLAKNWSENVIPNVVLSSATLPAAEDIRPMITAFKERFEFGGDEDEGGVIAASGAGAHHDTITTRAKCSVINIISDDCRRTIPIYNSEGYNVMPHTIYSDPEQLIASAKHCLKYRPLWRYLDVAEIGRFLEYVIPVFADKLDRSMRIETWFDGVDDVTIQKVKEYYLELLVWCGSDTATEAGHMWSVLIEQYRSQPGYTPIVPGSVAVTTSDAHTLTDGPTIYLAEDIDKIGKYCLKIAAIPQDRLDVLNEVIGRNEHIRKDIMSKEKDMADYIESTCSKGNSSAANSDKKDRKLGNGADSSDPVVRRFQTELAGLRGRLETISLDRKYIPNTTHHLARFGAEGVANAFCSDVDERTVEKIMALGVDAHWKLLLLMGIGVFSEECEVAYLEIMKRMAVEQKLYLVIASSDFIYGTNYQFCHGYIGKDLMAGMTSEKAIQALGRIGRSSHRQAYSVRLRENDLINRVFLPNESKVEATMMNRLFGC